MSRSRRIVPNIGSVRDVTGADQVGLWWEIGGSIVGKTVGIEAIVVLAIFPAFFTADRRLVSHLFSSHLVVVLLDGLVGGLRAWAGGAQLAPAEKEKKGGQEHQDDCQEDTHHHDQGWEDFFRLKTNTDLIGAARVGHGAAVITKIIAGSFSDQERASYMKSSLVPQNLILPASCGNRSSKMSPHQARGWRRRSCFAVDLYGAPLLTSLRLWTLNKRRSLEENLGWF